MAKRTATTRLLVGNFCDDTIINTLQLKFQQFVPY